MKSKSVAYLLWLPSLFLIAGLPRFYIGKIGTGILWLCTFGLFGVGSLVDLFTLGTQVDLYNTSKNVKKMAKASATPPSKSK